MNKKILIPIPAAGGKYPTTIGIVKNILNNIKSQYPDHEVHYSGISSGSACALLFLISSHTDIDVDSLHDEFIYVTEQLYNKSNHGIHSMNNAFFDGFEFMIRKYVTDINMVNNKLYIGYCKKCETYGIRFIYKSEYENIDELIHIIRASCHYPIILREKFYYEFNNKKYLDGVFMHDYLLIPGYKNITINMNSIKLFKFTDVFLNIDRKKHDRLHNIGLEHKDSNKIIFNESRNDIHKYNPTLYYFFNIFNKLPFAGNTMKKISLCMYMIYKIIT